MKYLVTATEAEAKAIQADSEAGSNLPWPGVFADGTPAGYGQIEHLYDIEAHPDGTKFACQVPDDYKAPAHIQASAATSLDATWKAQGGKIKDQVDVGGGIVKGPQ